MKITIDTEQQTITNNETGETTPLYSTEGFAAVSKAWLKVGWNEKHVYTFNWMGRPILQLPEDMVRMQEAIFQVKPSVIVETGIAHGGSLIYNASLIKALDIHGRIIGVDIDIRAHNRKAIEEHFLFPYISMIEGSSIAPEVVSQVKGLIGPADTVMVFLDSNHTKDHVLGELEAYAELVTPGSYIVAADGIMQDLADVPRGTDSWDTDNPVTAVHEFLAHHPEFALESPPWLFNESNLSSNINTYYPDGWLRRL